MDKYKNKYRMASTRLPNWDYGWNGAYFITICTKNREHFFGGISDGVVELSPIGHIANSCWYEIPHHFPFVELGAHIIMPNHVHGIIIIQKSVDARDNNVETQNIASLPPSSRPPTPPSTTNKPKNRFGPQSQNLASIVRGFKIGVTKNARQINEDFAWQQRYWDHIIRDENEYQRIHQYIINNPQKWENDKLNGRKGNIIMEPLPGYNSEDWMI